MDERCHALAARSERDTVAINLHRAADGYTLNVAASGAAMPRKYEDPVASSGVEMLQLEERSVSEKYQDDFNLNMTIQNITR